MKPLLIGLLAVLGVLFVGSLAYLRVSDFLERRRLERETDELFLVNAVRDALHRHRSTVDFTSVTTVISALAAAGELSKKEADAILADPGRYIIDPAAHTFDARWIADQLAETRAQVATH